MSCNAWRERLIALLEAAATPDEADAGRRHLESCEACRAEMDSSRAIRARLEAAARTAAAPALEERVMARLAPVRPPERVRPGSGAWWLPRFGGARARRLGLGAVGVAALALIMSAVVLRERPQAWSIEQSIAATRTFRALHLTGTFGGRARCSLWVRRSADAGEPGRLLIRIAGGPIIWTEGNATHYYDPDSRIVSTDDAQTAGFDPWPGPRLYEMARSAGVRMVDTRWRFPYRRSVVVEWSLMTTRGPTSARAEFDVDSKLLVGLTQWDNADRSGAPGFETHDITFSMDLPDEAFAVNLPAGVQYRPRPVEVAESVLGLLALPDAGMPGPDLSLSEASVRVVTQMWQAVIARDLRAFRQLCPVTRGWSDDFLRVVLGGENDPDAVVELLEVGATALRGHSRLGPVSVVTSRVRHRDGHVYEEKTIVQHRVSGPTASSVVYSGYGRAYRLR